jgi:hypothetical protein
VATTTPGMGKQNEGNGNMKNKSNPNDPKTWTFPKPPPITEPLYVWYKNAVKQKKKDIK